VLFVTFLIDVDLKVEGFKSTFNNIGSN